MIQENIELVNSLTVTEIAAICAVKAKVFIEYPPKGNDIALKFAEQACNLDSTEPLWKVVWLKAKGRVRRYHNRFSMPELNELNAAKTLCSYKTRTQFLIQAAQIYSEAGNFCKFNKMGAEASQYYSLAKYLLQ